VKTRLSRSPRNGERYEWTHPSWRDLIIGHLIRTPSDRVRFLERCNIHGILLALSEAGGPEGDRVLPLLIHDRDWEAIHATVKRLVEPQNVYTVGMALTALLDAISDTQPGSGADTRRREQLVNLAATALCACQQEWDANEAVVHLAVLKTYYELSIHIVPLPPMPNLLPTWKDHWESARSEVSQASEYETTVDQNYAMGCWLDLASWVGKSEPRFLKQVNFPDAFTEVVEKFLYISEQSTASDYELDSTDACEQEIELLDDLSSVIENVGAVFPQLAEKAQTAMHTIECEADEVRQHMDESDDEDSDDDPADSREWRDVDTRSLDIGDLFADL
jgi:hypothetical protein